MSTVNIPNGSITTVRLANDAVVSSKIKEGAVRTEQLADGAVTNAKISLSTPDRTSNDTTPATTAYVKTLIDDLVDSAPGSLDTLNEIAAALNDDANLGSALTTAIASETAARASADSALSASISNEVTVLNAAIAAEAADRTSAITAEAAARNMDIAIETNARTAAITVETNARTAAITAEAAARTAADSDLSAAITAESVARASAITSAVSAEADAREAAISAAIAGLIDSAPSALDTLNEIAAAMADDASMSVTLTNLIGSVSSAVSAETADRISALDLKAPSANPTFTGVIDITDASLQVTVLGRGGSFIQVGYDIDGESGNSGHSVSLSADGSVVAIGATGNNGNTGHVRVYAYNGTSWVQRGADIDGEAANDESGFSVSLSADGSVVAIGARYNNDYTGHVRVYAYNGTSSSWVQRGTDIDGEAAYDNSGHSVSLSADGSIVAIGAIGNDGNGNNSGHVRVYEWINSSWIQRVADINGEVASDESGYSVSLSADGSIVAIGARFNDGNGSNSGHVRVYEYNEGIQTQIALKAPLANPTFTGNVIMSLQDFETDTAAAVGGIPLNGLYRTGNVVKIRIA